VKAPSSRHSDVVEPSEWSSVECVIGCRSCVSNAGRHRRPDEVAIISQSIYGLAFGQVRIVAAYPWSNSASVGQLATATCAACRCSGASSSTST